MFDLCGDKRRETFEGHRGLCSMYNHVLKHVAQTLNNAGIHAEPMLHFDFKEPNSKRWIVKGDTSVKPPDGYEMVTDRPIGKTEYDFVLMEITSPAYYFCEDSLWSKGCVTFWRVLIG